MFLETRKIPIPQKPMKRNRGTAIELDELLEVCEQRLVFSAQPLWDIAAGAIDAIDKPSPVAIFPLLADAHLATGGATVQQDYGLSGRGQTVAVIDSGIAWDHSALGQGFGPEYRVVGGWDFAENDANPYDDGPAGFHGTHVSGIIGSDDTNSPGVARDVDFVALRVFDDKGFGKLEWVEQALEWVYEHRNAYENPITTVNVSVGTDWYDEGVPEWSTLEDELAQLHDAGIVVTAAAGNEFDTQQTTGLSYPASSQYVVPVASIDANGNLSDFSQRHSSVLAAPGDNVSSSVPDHVLGRDGKVDDFVASSGTSMAAPYVAGASVLVRQAMELADWDNITPESIVSHLRSTADSVYDSITNSSYSSLRFGGGHRGHFA